MNTTEPKPFTLRLPPELYEPISRMAERERRSLHGQVLKLLDDALEAMEDAADIRAADEAKAEGGQVMSFREALAEIQRERAALGIE